MSLPRPQIHFTKAFGQAAIPKLSVEALEKCPFRGHPQIHRVTKYYVSVRYSEWAGEKEGELQDTPCHLIRPLPNAPTGLESTMRVAVSSCMVLLQLAGPGLALGEGGLASVAFPLLRVRPCAAPRGQPGPPPTRFHLQHTQGGTRYHPRGSGGAAEQVGRTPFLGLHGSAAPRRALPPPCLRMQSNHLASK